MLFVGEDVPHQARTADVFVGVAGDLVHGLTCTCLGGEVDDGIYALDGLEPCRPIADVTDDEFDVWVR